MLSFMTIVEVKDTALQSAGYQSSQSCALVTPATLPLHLFNPGLLCVLYFGRTFVPPFRQQIAVQIAIRRFVLHASTSLDGDTDTDTDTAIDEQGQCQGNLQRPAGIDQARPNQARLGQARLSLLGGAINQSDRQAVRQTVRQPVGQPVG